MEEHVQSAEKKGHVPVISFYDGLWYEFETDKIN
jgi:hypothetical protein